MITILIVFFVLLALGVPIAFTLGISSLLALLELGNEKYLNLIPQLMVAGIDSFLLLAIPFFILAGNMMNKSNITNEIIQFSNVLVGHFRGGLAYVNILASTFFAGITGSAVADAGAMGSTLNPAMEKSGYSKSFAAAVTAASSIIGPIIPPSIIMIIYSFVMNVSIAGLFAAGILPGLLMAFGLSAYVFIIGKKEKFPVSEGKFSIKKTFVEGKKAIFALLMPIIILFGILSGMFTATEAAAIAVAYASIVGFFVKKTLKLRDIPVLLKDTAVTSSVVFLVISTSMLVQWVIDNKKIAPQISTWLSELNTSPLIILFLINVILLIAGMFLDTTPAILIFGPIFAPIILSLGVDPIHFGIVMTVNLAIGLVTPPLGVVLFVLSGIVKLPMEKLSIAVMPFLIPQIAVLFLVTYFPEISLFIPRLLGYL